MAVPCAAGRRPRVATRLLDRYRERAADRYNGEAEPDPDAVEELRLLRSKLVDLLDGLDDTGFVSMEAGTNGRARLLVEFRDDCDRLGVPPEIVTGLDD